MDRHHYPVEFTEFFRLFIPAAVNFLVPALIMSFVIPRKTPKEATDAVIMKRGARERVWAENHQNTRLFERLDKAIPFLHLHEPSALGTGDCAWVHSIHRNSYVAERQLVLMLNKRSPERAPLYFSI